MAKTVRELRLALGFAETKRGDWVVADVDGIQLVKKGTTQLIGALEREELSCVGVNAEGTLLAAVTYKEVSLFSLPGFKPLWSVKSAIFEARSLIFTKEGLWHCARTGAERLDLKSGKQREKVGQGTRPLAISADGKWWLAHGSENGKDAVGPAKKRRAVEFPAQVSAFLPDGTVLTADGTSGKLALALIDPASGAVKKSAVGVAVPGGPVSELNVSRSGKRAAVRVDEGFVTIDVDSLATKLLKLEQAQLAAFASDDQTLLLATRKFSHRKA